METEWVEHPTNSIYIVRIVAKRKSNYKTKKILVFPNYVKMNFPTLLKLIL